MRYPGGMRNILGYSLAVLVPISAVALTLAAANGCKSLGQVLAADEVAIDLTDMACETAENQTTGQPYVDIVCTLAEGVEDIIASVATTPDGGLTAVAGVRTIKLRIPAESATAFLAKYPKHSSKGPK